MFHIVNKKKKKGKVSNSKNGIIVKEKVPEKNIIFNSSSKNLFYVFVRNVKGFFFGWGLKLSILAVQKKDAIRAREAKELQPFHKCQLHLSPALSLSSRQTWEPLWLHFKLLSNDNINSPQHSPFKWHPSMEVPAAVPLTRVPSVSFSFCKAVHVSLPNGLPWIMWRTSRSSVPFI